MKKALKSFSIVVAVALVSCAIVAYMELSTNATYFISFNISSSGLSSTTWNYSTEIPDVTHGRVTIYIEKRSGLFGLGWTMVELGNPLNVQVYNLSSYPPAGGVTNEFQLTESGTYRAVAVFLLESDGEEITKTVKSSTVKYDG